VFVVVVLGVVAVLVAVALVLVLFTVLLLSDRWLSSLSPGSSSSPRCFQSLNVSWSSTLWWPSPNSRCYTSSTLATCSLTLRRFRSASWTHLVRGGDRRLREGVHRLREVVYNSLQTLLGLVCATAVGALVVSSCSKARITS
jgi:hypothetical protein